jgi:hypothetical protein
MKIDIIGIFDSRLLSIFVDFIDNYRFSSIVLNSYVFVENNYKLAQGKLNSQLGNINYVSIMFQFSLRLQHENTLYSGIITAGISSQLAQAQYKY